MRRERGREEEGGERVKERGGREKKGEWVSEGEKEGGSSSMRYIIIGTYHTPHPHHLHGYS